jgi:MFS family permease
MPPPGSRAMHIRLVWPLAASVCVAFGVLLYGFSVLITSSGAGGEFTPAELSLAYAGSIFIGGAASVPVGIWSDARGIRGVIAMGGLLVLLGLIGFAFSVDPWQMILSWWVLIGPGTAMVLFDPAFIGLQQWFSGAARNRAIGALALIAGLAGPIFTPLTYVLMESIGWRLTTIGLGIILATVSWATAGWALAVVPKLPNRRLPREPKASIGCRIPHYLLLTIAVGILFGTLEAMQVHRIARFEDVGFNTTDLVAWAALSSVLGLPVRYVLPYLAQYVGSGNLLAALIWLLVPALICAIGGSTQLEMVAHFLIFGAVFGATIPMRAVVMSEWFSGPHYGRLMGIQGLVISLGRALCPLSVGWMRDTTHAYTSAMIVLVVAAIVSAILVATAIAFRNARG